MKRSDNKNRSGFTLIEALIATFLIGIAVAALMTSNIAHTQANAYGMHTSTAEFLIEEIRAMTMPLAITDPESDPETNPVTFGIELDEAAVTDYDDLDDFDGLTFNPPIDVNGNTLNDFSLYSQIVTVEYLNPADLTSVVADLSSSIVRVSVTVTMNGKEIGSTNWVRAQQ